MKYLNLKLIKQQLNLDDNFNEDDEYLTLLGGVVETVVEKHIDDSLSYLTLSNNNELPTPLIQAMLLLLSTYYSNREHVAFTQNYEVKNSYTYLLDLYRNYSCSHSDGSNYDLLNEIKTSMNNIKTNTDKINLLQTDVDNLKNKSDEISNKVADLKKITIIGSDSIDVENIDENTKLTANKIDGGEY